MAKAIEINKPIDRVRLDEQLAKLNKKYKPTDLKKYAGKVDFGVNGLEYQLKSRNEWR
ncbi:hypothetical protein [Daejeonella sp.]|uniref:hypothetical protein n=1 Tax=Daejeonella sp. TaxID=2805397 RepID=UPI00272F2A69|nr:hypothetical protein [Daejeonella sp.]MDP2413290.1 hypothetical protein [Daejeonella sp.]